MTSAGYVAVAGIVGACIGSFLNVVIWRLPRGESLMHPPSRCPVCGTSIRWFDNVPVLAWLLLRGRCRRCRAGISVRYPFVEALTAALFVLVALRHGPSEIAVAATKAAVLAALLAISAIDWDHKMIPDAITKPGIVLGLLLAVLVPELHEAGFIPRAKPGLSALAHAAAGAALGWFVIVAIRFVASRSSRRRRWASATRSSSHSSARSRGRGRSSTRCSWRACAARCSGRCGLPRARGASRRSRARSRASSPGSTAPTRSGTPRRPSLARASRPSASGWTPPALLEPGARVRLRMRLAANDLFADEDAQLDLRAVVEERMDHRLALRLEKVAPDDEDRLATFALVRRYIPFGPFLALGGAAMLLYGDEVVRFTTETWPSWIRGE